ncbi:hypothetical protein XOC_0721 [Xanthomonas oryzae pv. oryzicola BLS256]|uniref:Uncharacterized protein n=1 Tax=Xanthomonas oryzae pv. oryzicola (strain BLS256) TaxID=383407 RepID=G7TCE2_XANOB|nr:hypothetical protein XOC_0721 [Xanthomonas oryzae pv. oryzicola BLS256]
MIASANQAPAHQLRAGCIGCNGTAGAIQIGWRTPRICSAPAKAGD